MLKVQKNDVAFKELSEYSKSVSMSLKDVLRSDDHLDKISSIFYKHMPKMIRWSMNETKFKEFYKNHREQFAANIAV